jgi:predicted nucleic acid-binding protein
LVLAYRGLSARDAIHAAVMKARGISRILSFDAGYDSLPGLVRIFA